VYPGVKECFLTAMYREQIRIGALCFKQRSVPSKANIKRGSDNGNKQKDRPNITHSSQTPFEA
jgi:hypothetical protein